MTSAEKLHYDRLQSALKQRKLILFQYSCTQIKKENVKITSVFALDYFSDAEWYRLASNPLLHRDVSGFLAERKNYYFAFWNYNPYYGFGKFDLRLSEEDFGKLEERCIDLDAASQYYGEKMKQGYIGKMKGGLDKRYYLALLNNLNFQRDDWITGKHEANIRNLQVLKGSSRAKIHVIRDLIELMQKKKLLVKLDTSFIKKSKKIGGVRALIRIKLKSRWEIIEKILLFVLGSIVTALVQLIFE